MKTQITYLQTGKRFFQFLTVLSYYSTAKYTLKHYKFFHSSENNKNQPKKPSSTEDQLGACYRK